jgi:putative colanic acid biosynthesis acetyltransferase WcaF
LLISSHELFTGLKLYELKQRAREQAWESNADAAAAAKTFDRQMILAPERTDAPHASHAVRQPSPWSLKQKIARVLWMLTRLLLFRPSFHNWYAWRRFLLRCFGAKIGRGVRIRPSALIEIPWNLQIADHAIIGDYAIIYSLGKITIGRHVVISQYAHLCAGTHDYTQRRFPLLRPPIVLEEDVWIAADAFVGPGVTIAARSILGARASAFADLPPDIIAVGNPAKPIKPRVLEGALSEVPGA